MGEETTIYARGHLRTKENGGDGRHATARDKSPAPGSTSAAPSSHATLAYVFLFLLVDLLGFTVILPLIPSLLEYYDRHDKVCTTNVVLLTTFEL